MKRIMVAVVVVLLSSVAGCSSDAPSTDAPSTEAPVTTTPSTDAPSTDAPSTDAPVDLFPNSPDPFAFLNSVREMSPLASQVEDSDLIEQGDFFCDFARQNESRGSSSIRAAVIDVIDQTAKGDRELTTLSVAMFGQALLHLCPEFSYVITELSE